MRPRPPPSGRVRLGVGQVVAAVRPHGGDTQSRSRTPAVVPSTPIIVRPAVSKLKVTRSGGPNGAAAVDRRFDLLHRGHRLDPKQIGTSLGKACRLLGEDISSVGRVERTKRREEFAGRTHRACDENPSLKLVDNVTGMTSSLAIDLDDTVVEFVQLKTEA